MGEAGDLFSFAIILFFLLLMKVQDRKLIKGVESGKLEGEKEGMRDRVDRCDILILCMLIFLRVVFGVKSFIEGGFSW